MKKTVRAALYYRMSRDEQEHSIARQRGQVEPYAERAGYVVVATYVDEGVRGWKAADERPDFLRMLQDAQRGLFDVIVCDEVDRFGRYDPIDYGRIVAPLRDARVKLETVKEGKIDWEDTLSILTDSMRMAFKKEESNTISRRILTRFVLMAQQGKWFNGTPPFAYAVDEATGRLSPGDPAKVKVVQWLFKTYAEQDVSIRWLGEELRKRGVPSPTGRDLWTAPTLRKILTNRNYLGDFHWNTSTVAQFQHLRGGQVVKREEEKSLRRNNEEAEWIVVAGTHPPLVDRDVFQAVQARLKDNRRKTTPSRGGGEFLLRCMMRCGHCGETMSGAVARAHRTRTHYECSGYRHYGKAFCNRHWIYEDDVVRCVIRKIREAFLNPEHLAMLRAELRRQAEAERRETPTEAARLRRQMGELDVNIRKGTERLAIVEEDMVSGLSDTIRGWRADRERLARQLEQAEQGPDLLTAEQEIVRAEAHLWQLQGILDKGDPVELRSVISEFVDHIELFWTHRERGPHTVGTFTRGVIHVRSDLQLVNQAKA